MRVALVGPELEENLALRYIHASVAAAGHEARIFDFHQADQTPELARAIAAYDPAVVGLSMVFTARTREYMALAGAVRALAPRAHLTAGGHFASFHALDLLREFPAMDSVLHGEGEAAMIDLLAHLDYPWDTAGISCRAPGGEVVETPPRPPLEDLDALPTPTRPERFQDYFGLPIANMLAGRGCFGACHFCSIQAWHRKMGGPRFRQRSAVAVAAEMAALYRDRGVRIFNFHDDNFFLPEPRANVERFETMRRMLDERGVGRIAIQVKARPDSIDAPTARALKDLGCFRVFLGVESNSVAGLKALGRGITRRQNHEALAILKGLGLHVTFNLLMFEPEATIEDLRQNAAFIAEQADVPLNFCRTEVYTGTPLEARLRKQGRLMGDYMGYTYRIAAPAAQRAYEIFREVFSPRNFDLDGMNLMAMTLDYEFHLLRHFFPRAAKATLQEKVKGWIRDLNADNASRLGAILDFAVANPGVSVAQAAGEFARDRVRFDQAARRRAQAILVDIRQMGRRRTIGRGISRKASAAAAAVFVTVLGYEATGPYSCEAAPRGLTARAEELPEYTAPFEMVAREPETQPAPPPESQPATRPASQPASAPVARALTGDQVKAVEAHIRQVHMPAFRDAAMADRLAGQSISVPLELGDDGAVRNLSIPAKESLTPEDRKNLETILRGWTFPMIRQGGSCVVTLVFPVQTPAHEMVPPPPNTHMSEMPARPPGDNP